MKDSKANFKKKIHKPVVISLVAFVACLTLVMDLPEYIKGTQASNWKTVQGMLMTRDVKAVDVGSARVLKMKLRYQYVANGKVYFGNRMSFQEKPAFNGLEIAEIEKKYKLGEKVTVYYDPNNANEACLEPGAQIVNVLSHFIIYSMFAIVVYFSTYPKVYKTKPVDLLESESKEEDKIESSAT